MLDEYYQRLHEDKEDNEYNVIRNRCIYCKDYFYTQDEDDKYCHHCAEFIEVNL